MFDLVSIGNYNYAGTYSDFTVPGKYEIAVYAMNEDGNVSIPLLTMVYKSINPDDDPIGQESGSDLTGEWTYMSQKCKGAVCKLKGSMNVRNTGDEQASSCAIRFYMSEDGIYDGGDMFLREISTGNLKAGMTKRRKLNSTLPSGETATDKYIIAVIDAHGAIGEKNEGNNHIVHGPILRADLTGSWASLIPSCKNNKCKLKGNLNVQNTGHQDASSTVRFYMSDDGVYDGGDTYLKEVSTGNIKVGMTKGRKLNYRLPEGETVTGKYVIGVIDPDDLVLEVIEINNYIPYGPLL
jgi:hypothetical protein